MLVSLTPISNVTAIGSNTSILKIGEQLIHEMFSGYVVENPVRSHTNCPNLEDPLRLVGRHFFYLVP